MYDNLKFGINYHVFFGGEWIPIVRYDNHLHKKKSGKPLHRIERDWKSVLRDLKYQEGFGLVELVKEGRHRMVDIVSIEQVMVFT